MLLELHIRNFALIEQADLEFREGLNVLSGETGAGKSILIDSIAAALGGKAGRDLIRTGADSAYIELIFSVDGEERLARLRELGITPEKDGTLILTRRILPTRSVLKINDGTVTAALLRKLTGALIDIHGQHEIQTLFDPETHLRLVDLMAPAQLGELKRETALTYRRYAELQSILKKEADSSFREREKEILRYEIQEISDAALKEGEEETLQADFLRSRNAARIRAALGEVTDALGTDAVSRAVRRLGEVERFAPELSALREQLSELDSLLNDAARSARERSETTEFDEETLERLTARLDTIHHLQDKYGEDVAGIRSLLGEKQERLDFLLSFEENREAMQEEREKIEQSLEELSAKISGLRQETAALLSARISEELKTLNFQGAEFEVRISARENFGADGRDAAEFYIRTNPGEPLKPLRNIASGGELSRIMLALKTVLADRDEIETLIFDEIDAGISGRTAQMVSEKLFRIGRSRQVLCITHLPQIAAMADHHYLIAKESGERRTRTGIREITGDEITEELGRLIGGSEITEGVLRTAREMKELAEREKGFCLSDRRKNI